MTISSLVEDMLDSYANVTRGLHGFSWKQNLASLIEEFIFTRDCFFCSPNRAPVVEARFSVLHYHADELDVDLHFTWNPPSVDFCDLRNVITEGNEFVLRPNFNARPHGGLLSVTAEYFVGPGDGWLRWDEEKESFRGTVPRQMASHVGAERFEAYTVPLELTARITKHFPGTMRFERIFRCALPLTVKRRPSRCARDEEMTASPRIPRDTGSKLTKGQPAPFRTPEKPNRAPPSVADLGRGSLTRPPLMRSPLRRLNVQPRAPPPTPRTRIFSCENKENEELSMEDVHKLMERKAQSPKPQSPLRLDSLSLARLHDAVALAHPPPYLTDLEVRMVREVRHDSFVSDKENTTSKAENATSRADGSVRRVNVTPLRETGKDSRSEINLGSTHVNRHGKLASRSEPDDKSDSSSLLSPPTRNISPPQVPAHLCSPLMYSASSRKMGKRPQRNTDSPTKPDKKYMLSMTKLEASEELASNRPRADSAGAQDANSVCYSCAIHGRDLGTVDNEDAGVCRRCQEATIHLWVDEMFKSGGKGERTKLWKALLTNRNELHVPQIPEGQEAKVHRWVKGIFEHGTDEGKMALWNALLELENAAEPQQELVSATPSHGVNDTLGWPAVSVRQKEAAVQHAIDEWQAAIQQNFKEFESKPSRNSDVFMEDNADSDEELPSFHSDTEAEMD